jgi:enediyne biosynthesis protein E4
MFSTRWIGLCLLALACGGGGGAADAGGDGGDGGLPPAICNAGSRWQPGTAVFREVTDDWGLTAAGAMGARISVTDIDGDGWADLFVRNGGGPDDFTTGGTRASWLLRNTHAGFEDVTVASGVRANRAGNPDFGRLGEVVASADVDNDGDLDIFTAAPSDTEAGELMKNDGTGSFSLGPTDSDARLTLSPAGVSFIDYDRDGFIDLWIAENARGSATLQDRLYRGDGSGAFADVTDGAGLTTLDWDFGAPDPSLFPDLNAGLGHSWGWSSAACDLNGDGSPELLAASYGRAPNSLFQAVGDGTYTNRSVASGYAYDDNQDWTDNISAQCYCNDYPADPDCDLPPPPSVDCVAWKAGLGGQYRWNHATDREAFRLGGNSAATTCADVDNDGAIDLVTGEIAHWDVGANADKAELLVNSGETDVRFSRPGNDATGLSRAYPAPLTVTGWNQGIMTSAVFDFDNDGWQDVYLGDSDYPGDRGRLYHQESAGHFVELDTGDFFEHNRSHGVVAADFDHDGDLDVIVGHSLARCDATLPNNCYATAQVRAFENLMGEQSNWIQVRLEGGPGTNRAAIGARVTVTAGGVTQTQEVDGGHGHYGTQNDRVLHFGLGESCEAQVTVRWPDAALDTQEMSLPSGYRFYVKQGSAPVVDSD